MYSVDLKKISLDEFADILKSIDLLPGRRILLDHLDRVTSLLKAKKINTLSDLQTFLKKKSDYARLAGELGVDENYLLVLNREVNSYESKPVEMEKLDIFTETEKESLHKLGIKTTKDLYQRLLSRADRIAFIKLTGLTNEKVAEAIILCDLLRINGVGPVYAKILKKMGIKGVESYLSAPSEMILERYQKINEIESLSKAKLGLKDVEYCKRFCSKLDKEIAW
jgi:hypothetical protein